MGGLAPLRNEVVFLCGLHDFLMDLDGAVELCVPEMGSLGRKLGQARCGNGAEGDF
jgi:hypothetical protein